MKKIISVVMVLFILMSGGVVNVKAENYLGFECPFSDVVGHWAEFWITKSTFVNLVSGYSDGKFRPDNKVTVGEYIKMITMLYIDLYQYKEPANGEHWALQYVRFLQSNHNLSYGMYETSEELDRLITRKEMADISIRALFKVNSKAIGDSGISIDKDAEYQNHFSDINELTADEKTFINTLYKYEIVNGFEDGTFRPYDGLSRAEAVKIIMSLKK